MVMAFAGFGFALTFDDRVDSTPPVWISSSDPNPAYNGWFKLDLPGWYDSTLVDAFKITLGGHGDNSSEPIDVFLSFDLNHTSAVQIASKNVPNTVPFTLTEDIFANSLFLNNNYAGPLANVNLANFDGKSFFWVGYGCHFYHDYTQVHVEQSNRVPEPGTMLLFGTGLIGMLGFRKKIKK
jgi:hypothetical protein